MIAALICVVSATAFVEFLALYCRTVVNSVENVRISDRVREVAGITGRGIGADDFAHLLQLVRLCPESGADRMEIRAVGTYYSLLNIVGQLSRVLAPRVAAWANRERRGCSYFAAVALDRRVSYNRDLFSQQASGNI
jgi:hypothetical protein